MTDDNQQISSESDDSLDLMAVAAAADAAPKSDTEPSTSKPAQDESREAADQAESAQQKLDEQKQPEAEKDQAKEKAETPYKKAQREAERREKSWKQLEAEKAAFREEKSRWLAEQEALKRQRSEPQKPATPAAPAKDEHGYTAEDYDKLADSYAKDGDAEMALKASRRAAQLRNAAGAQPSEAAKAAPTEVHKTPEFQTQWKANIDSLVQKDPALADPENPITKSANALLTNPDWRGFFLNDPRGIIAAVEVARLQANAGRVPALTKELDSAKAEIARLTKLTTPLSAPPHGVKPGAPSIDKMSDDELSDFALSAALQADRG